MVVVVVVDGEGDTPLGVVVVCEEEDDDVRRARRRLATGIGRRE